MNKVPTRIAFRYRRRTLLKDFPVTPHLLFKLSCHSIGNSLQLAFGLSGLTIIPDAKIDNLEIFLLNTLV